MAEFPALKTGAVAQYPSTRAQQWSTRVHEFVSGDEQRSPLFAGPLRRWLIQLNLLSEGELFTLEEFYVEQGGGSGSFSFTDPWDGIEYLDCSFEGNEMVSVFEAISDGEMRLVIRENR